MKSNNIEQAKQLFLKYGGSHFLMAREGEYDLYRSFNIPKEQEYMWIQDYENKLLMEIEREAIIDGKFVDLCLAIREYRDVCYLEKLQQLIKQRRNSMDSFSLMRMAEGLLGIVDSFLKSNMKNHKITLLAKEFALEILNSILENPITIASYYKRPGYLIDPIDEEKLIARVKESINWWR